MLEMLQELSTSQSSHNSSCSFWPGSSKGLDVPSVVTLDDLGSTVRPLLLWGGTYGHVATCVAQCTICIGQLHLWTALYDISIPAMGAWPEGILSLLLVHWQMQIV
jgi:hypothetical protein